MRLVLTLCATLLVVGCSGSPSSPSGPGSTDRADVSPGVTSAPSSSPTPDPATTASPSPPASVGATVWLCRPGLPANPCTQDLGLTVVSPDGTRMREPFRPARRPSFDCFYVYPTVSTASRTNAPRRVAPELARVVRAQAALFGRECRVFAPVYRQVTLQGLMTGGFFDAEARALAHSDVVAAWQEYLQRWNRGRPFLLLGHSQGAFELTDLIAEEIDDNPDLRKRLVSAMLLGGIVTVPEGGDAGGSFQHVPSCRTRTQTGCVVAYNTFSQQPPPTSLFGRATSGQQVVCVNPSAPAGGRAALTPYVPQESAGRVRGLTAYPGAVTAQCRQGDGATWLNVEASAALPAELTAEPLGPAWGLHTADVNVALGDLVALAARQAAALG